MRREQYLETIHHLNTFKSAIFPTEYQDEN
jgi:hypothetical protein